MTTRACPAVCPSCGSRSLCPCVQPAACECCPERSAKGRAVPREWVEAADLYLLAAVQSAFPPEARVTLVHQARRCLRGEPEALAEYKNAKHPERQP